MIVATAFVLMMTTPALALFYGGMTRTKSVLNIMMMSFVAMGVVGIVFVLWGWSEGWGADGTGNANGQLIANPFHEFGLLHVSSSNFIYVLFQLTFAVITVALISGSIADRVKIGSWVVFCVLWVTLVYFPIAHNIWAGGWFAAHFRTWTTLVGRSSTSTPVSPAAYSRWSWVGASAGRATSGARTTSP